MKKFLPYSMPNINKDDKNAVIRALESGMLVMGPLTDKFEENVKNYLSVPYSLAVSSGTSALYLIAKSLNINSNHSVIVPSITFLATANAFSFCGAEIIFSDCDKNTGLVTEKHIKEAIKRASKPVKAIVVVHLGGRIVDLKEISTFAKKRKIFIIEDACHCFGSVSPLNKKSNFVGSCEYSIASSFSFHGTKNITTGEGGMITTRNKKLYDKAKVLRHNGINKNPPFIEKNLSLDKTNKKANNWYYEMRDVSLNFKMSEINAALGISQLKRINKFKKNRHLLRKFYDNNISEIPNIQKVGINTDLNLMDHLYQVKINFSTIKKQKNQITKELLKKGIGTQVHYMPIHLQPFYKKKTQNLKNSVTFYNDTISIPFHNNMNEKDGMKVIKAIKEIVK